MDELEIIAKLRDALRKGNLDENWDLTKRLGSLIDGDQHAPDSDRETFRALNSAISDVVIARNLDQAGNEGRVSVALTALEGSIKKRTTGLDGWRLA